MIQRIQTLFLILTVGVFGALFRLPFATSDQATAQFLSDKIFDITDHIALLSLAGLGAALSLTSIFLFKNRTLQLRVGYLTILLAILLPILAILLFKNESSQADAVAQVNYQTGMFLPIAAIIFTSLANYFIKKDDKLVKSMDRLR